MEWQPAAHGFEACSAKRWRVVPPADAGLGVGTLLGGGGSTPHRKRSNTLRPRLTGCEPVGEPVTVRKPARVIKPARWLGSSDMAPLWAPYTEAKLAGTLLLVPVISVAKLLSPANSTALMKARFSSSIALATASLYSG
jgi:hypothetical protein